MKKTLLTVSFLTFFTFTGCSDEGSGTSLVATSETQIMKNFDESMQLSEADRDTKAEKLFLDKFKAVAKAGDLHGFKKLYSLENANPEYVAMIDYIFNKKWAKYFNDISFSIEPNDKAKKYSTYFTIPYLGDMVVKSVSGKSVGTTKIPLGIKDGIYYLTIGSK